MKFSVLTPSIRPQFLDITQRCLESQTFQDFEWLTEIGLPSRGFTLPSDFNKMLKRANGNTIIFLQDCITIPDNALENIAKLDGNVSYTFPVRHGTWDWRNSRNGEIQPNEWEIDLAAAPIQMFFDVGGFDEDFCKGWSWENVEIAWRASNAGHKFEVSQMTFGEALDHDKMVKHPFRNVLLNNDRRASVSKIMAEAGRIKLSYL